MDETLGDGLERSTDSSALYLPESPEGPVGVGVGGGVGGFSLDDSPYAFERRAVASAVPDAAPSRPPVAKRERRGRGRWAPGGGHPGAAAASPPIVAPRRSRKRRRRASEARGRRGEESGGAAAAAPSSPPAAGGHFPTIWPEPRQQPSSSSSSSSCSSSSSLSSTSEEGRAVDRPSSPGRGRGGDESDGLGSLSFLTAEERAWLGGETTGPSAAPPPPSPTRGEVAGEESAAPGGVRRDAQVEGDALLARQLQEQFDREERRLLPLPPFGRRLHRHRRQPDVVGGEVLDTPGEHQQQQHRAQSFGTTLDLLPDADLPWLAAVQWVAQPRGRGRGFRRAPQRGGGGGVVAGGSGIEGRLLWVGQGHADHDDDDYEALLDYEERQGPAAAAAAAATKRKLSKREINAFPTKTYDPAAQSAAAAGNTRCQICFCDYAGGEELRMLTCFHDYHAKCIDRWLRVNATCPVCRCDMAERRSRRAEV